MGVPNIIGLHLSREFARRLEHQPVIKHLDLYFRALDVVGSMAASVDSHLLNDELRVVAFCYELVNLASYRFEVEGVVGVEFFYLVGLWGLRGCMLVWLFF